VTRRLLVLLALRGDPRLPGISLGRRRPSIPTERPRESTVKIQVGHLHGGSARFLSTVPVTGTVRPYRPRARVDVTFYLNGHRWSRRR